MNGKQTAALILAGSMCLTLAACGGKTQKDGAEGSGGGSGSTGSVTVAIWDNAQLAGLKEIMGDFTSETGIPVEIQVVTWDQYWTLLEAGAQGGSMPDVFWMHSNYSQKFMSNDILLDLTDRIGGSEMIELSNYYQDIVGLYQYDGKTYAIRCHAYAGGYGGISGGCVIWFRKSGHDYAGLLDGFCI